LKGIGMVRILGIVLVVAISLPLAVIAQAPGSRCVTPKGWCWASPPGSPGQPYTCPDPAGGGVLSGTLE
jgi:hypothetical protein